MEKDMYPSVDDSPDSQDQEPDSTDQNEKDSGKETTLIPKSMCPGMGIKPGDSLTFKVVSVHDNEVEVEYDDGNEKKESDSPEMAGAMGSLSDAGRES